MKLPVRTGCHLICSLSPPWTRHLSWTAFSSSKYVPLLHQKSAMTDLLLDGDSCPDYSQQRCPPTDSHTFKKACFWNFIHFSKLHEVVPCYTFIQQIFIKYLLYARHCFWALAIQQQTQNRKILPSWYLYFNKGCYTLNEINKRITRNAKRHFIILWKEVKQETDTELSWMAWLYLWVVSGKEDWGVVGRHCDGGGSCVYSQRLD